MRARYARLHWLQEVQTLHEQLSDNDSAPAADVPPDANAQRADSDATASAKAAPRPPNAKPEQRLPQQQQQHLHSLRDFATKLRPGVFDFLQRLSAKFRLYIYTMGDEQYACLMASLLDPHGHLFRNRVINRADSNWSQHQKGLEKLGLGPTMALVVDDTPGAHHASSAAGTLLGSDEL